MQLLGTSSPWQHRIGQRTAHVLEPLTDAITLFGGWTLPGRSSTGINSKVGPALWICPTKG